LSARATSRAAGINELGAVRTYRPTALKMASRHCPRVLCHLEAGDIGRSPFDFQPGIAAHAVLQAVGEQTNRADRELAAAEVDRVAGAVCQALIERGRTFDGKPEPPLAADAVWSGRDLALLWLALNPPTPGAQYEVGLAVDAQWQPCAYDSPHARFRAIVDVLRRDAEGDEEQAWRAITLRDYKSAWPTDETELETLQLRGHAVLAWIHFGDGVDVIRREVVNLRTRKVYGGDFEHELQMGSAEDLAKLRRWRDDLQATMDSYDRMAELGGGRMPANPGAGCDGCPFLPRCVEAQDYVERAGAVAAYGSPEERARGFAVASAIAAGLKDWLKAETGEAPIDLGNALVGTVGKDGRAASALAYATLYEHWMANGGALNEGAVRGLLKALKLSLSNIEAAGKAIFPSPKSKADQAGRADLLTLCSVPDVKREFGIHKKAIEEASAA